MLEYKVIYQVKHLLSPIGKKPATYEVAELFVMLKSPTERQARVDSLTWLSGQLSMSQKVVISIKHLSTISRVPEDTVTDTY